MARILVGVLLFTALLITYLAAFPSDIDINDHAHTQAELAKFGQAFVLILLLVQAALVVLVTPLFVSGAIVEETERRTLEFLLATDLVPREIVLGKLWPRLLLVLGIVLVGLPVLGALQVWGGVDYVFVALASVVVLATAWAVAGVSAASAVGARTLRQAMIRAYGWSFLVLTIPLFSCPFSVIVVLANAHEAAAQFNRGGGPVGPGPAPTGPDYTLPLILLGIHVGLQFLIGALGIRRATDKLRHSRYYFGRVRWTRPAKPAKWEQHPSVPDGSPLMWKELYLSGQTARLVRMLNLVPWVIWLCVSSVFMVVGLAAALSSAGGMDVLWTVNAMARWGGGLMVGLMALMVGLHAAGSLARERQQETLTDLLMVPRPRREIIQAKWLGSLAKARGVAVGTLAVPLVGVLAEGLSFWAVVPLILATFAFVGCAASLGLWVSVRSRTVQRASGVWLLVVGLWVGGTFLAAQAAYMEERNTARTMFVGAWSGAAPPESSGPFIWDRALNPALAWSQLTFRVRSDGEFRGYYLDRKWDNDGVIHGLEDIAPSLCGILFFAFLAWAFYAAAVRRFEREGR